VASSLKAILPKRANWGPMLREIYGGLNEGADMFRDAFKDATRTWSPSVAYFVEKDKVTLSSRYLKLTVWAEDERLAWVNDGTKRHWVGPKNASVLAFPTQYVAKSSPGSLSAKGGFRGGPMGYSKGHYVSGIKPRKFNEGILKKYGPKFYPIMYRALMRGIAASGQKGR